MLATSKVGAATYKTRSECQVEEHSLPRTELVGAAERARESAEAARLGGLEIVYLERAESRRREEDRIAGSVMSTNSSLSMAAIR